MTCSLLSSTGSMRSCSSRTECQKPASYAHIKAPVQDRPDLLHQLMPAVRRLCARPHESLRPLPQQCQDLCRRPLRTRKTRTGSCLRHGRACKLVGSIAFCPHLSSTQMQGSWLSASTSKRVISALPLVIISCSAACEIVEWAILVQVEESQHAGRAWTGSSNHLSSAQC